MKKTNVIVLIGLCLLFTGILLTNCEKKSSTEVKAGDLVGTWVLTKVTITFGTGQSITLEGQALQAAGISGTITIRADGTYTAVMNMGDDPITENGTWTIDGNNLTLTTSEGSETVPFTLSGNKLTITITEDIDEDGQDDTMKLEFTKQ